MEWKNGGYLLSDDQQRLDLDSVCRLLSDTYWAAGRPREIMARAIENSVCVGLYHSGEQVGFARGVTDGVTFTWICDVIIDAAHRGHGLGKWMVQTLLEHPRVQTRAQVLATRDAHGLYERYGFQRTEYMRRYPLGDPPVWKLGEEDQTG
jgi:GNAT superfamily N-acetyltransferase